MIIKKQSSTEKSSADEITSSIDVEKGNVRTGFRAWAKSLSVEVGGIQRVADEDRQTYTTKVWNACTFW